MAGDIKTKLINFLINNGLAKIDDYFGNIEEDFDALFDCVDTLQIFKKYYNGQDKSRMIFCKYILGGQYYFIKLYRADMRYDANLKSYWEISSASERMFEIFIKRMDLTTFDGV